jgi:hypothetical protein
MSSLRCCSHWPAGHDVSDPLQSAIRDAASSVPLSGVVDSDRLQYSPELDSSASFDGGCLSDALEISEADVIHSSPFPGPSFQTKKDCEKDSYLLD